MSFAEFVSMGGYGFYVWGSYAACALAIAIEIIAVRTRLAAAQRAAGRREPLR
jgi:heme exporter protein D